MPSALELAGKRFVNLVAIRRIGVDTAGCVLWTIQCDCGTVLVTTGRSLVRGKRTSCGCQKIARARAFCQKRNPKHGHAVRNNQAPEYRTWKSMKNRCYNMRNPSYPYYGLRGIYVCDRWRFSYESFFTDMGGKPSTSHSIDRIDNNKGYEPSNCRWATKKEQANNRCVKGTGIGRISAAYRTCPKKP